MIGRKVKCHIQAEVDHTEADHMEDHMEEDPADTAHHTHIFPAQQDMPIIIRDA